AESSQTTITRRMWCRRPATVTGDQLGARRHPQRQVGGHQHILARFPEPNFWSDGEDLARHARTFIANHLTAAGAS
ncbi:MAG: hypothetical protein WBF75_01340, partial [Pseudonocardiaceae bacterium]